jgi:hypothetical protein
MKQYLLLAAAGGFSLAGVFGSPEGLFPSLGSLSFPAAIAQEEEPAADPAAAEAKEGEEEPTPEVKAKKKSVGAGDPAAGPKPAATGATAKAAKKKPSLDDQYVLDNLEKFLSPTKMEVLPDGRVKLLFEFSEKKEEHEGIFTPRVAKEVQSTFRWSVPGEYAGYYGTSARSVDGTYYYGALRISQQGAAHLNAFFTDDIEAEMQFANGSSTSQAQTVALVYTSGSKSLGSNWGTQIATFESGKMRGRKGAVENAAIDTGVKIKLVVRNGIFEAHREGRQKQTDKYNPKSYSSGKVGFIWSGGIAGFVYRLEITGRLDSKKMADLIRKQRR